VIRKQLRIIPGDQGGFRVEGIAGIHQFNAFDDADTFAREKLVQIIREQAVSAGTSCQTVTIKFKDQLPTTAGGDAVFMGRTVYGSLTGRPDIVLTQSCINLGLQ